MAGSRRQVEIGSIRARDLIATAGRELRDARLDRDLSLGEIARSVGISAAKASRIERGLSRGVSVWDLARLHAVLGLELSMRSFPAGQPIRDAAHIRLLADFAAGVHRSVVWTTEVPLPVPGDARAWDGLIRGPDWRYGVEAETAPRDAQGLTRRLNLKARDSDVGGVILIVPDTTRARAFVRDGGGPLRAAFPIDGRTAASRLGAGLDPGGSSLIVVRSPRRQSRPGA